MVTTKKAFQILNADEDTRNKLIDKLSEENAKYLLKIAFKFIYNSIHGTDPNAEIFKNMNM